jgi:hypothetical protein
MARRNVVFIAAAFTVFSGGAMPAAQAQGASRYVCKTIVGRCAVEVGGLCERVGDFEQVTYIDRSGATMVFERCVSRLSKAEGKPDPYAPKPAGR